MSMTLPIPQLTLATLAVVGAATIPGIGVNAQSAPQAAAPLPDIGERRTITEADCTATKLGTAVPVAAIGEPVSNVTLSAPRWTAAVDPAPAYCTIDGAMAPIDPAAKPINFRVVLPASWTLRAAQLGGGGMNGIIPNLTGGRGGSVGPVQGIVTYGSDSGHGVKDAPEWTLVDETIRNLGYMQMKKTRDAAMVLVERAYGRKPAVNYYIGTSQGGREALTVAQRYPDDYDGIISNVPIVNFSSLMLAPGLIRIQEKPLANWVTRAKVNAIRGEFMRQCDSLDGLADGDHQQLSGVPRHLRRHPGRQGAPAVGVQALPEQRRSRSGRYDGSRLPDRRTDLDAPVRLQPLPVCRAARERRANVRDVGAEYRSVGERVDLRRALPGAGRRGARCADALAPWRPGRDRVPDAQPDRQPARLCGGRTAGRPAARVVSVARLDQPGPDERLPRAAAG